MKFKSKKFEICVCILNIILIIVMIILLFHGFSGKKETAKSNADTVDNTDFSFDEANNALTDVYTTLIKGTTVKISNDKQMHFGTDGGFDGFFDENSPAVEEYSYEVQSVTDGTDQNGVVAIVNIYNKDRSQYVQYNLVYGGSSADPELLLQYPGTGKTYALEF